MLTRETMHKIGMVVGFISIVAMFVLLAYLAGSNMGEMKSNETKSIENIKILPTPYPIDPFGISKTASSIIPLSKEETEMILSPVMNATLTEP